jgi:hypothetical protein
MDVVVLDGIRFQPDIESLKKKLRIKEGTNWDKQVTRLVSEAEAIARPRAMYGVAYVDSKGENNVVVDGIQFDSRILRVNLENTHRVFPFVCTCGTELHEWADAEKDMSPGSLPDWPIQAQRPLFRLFGDAAESLGVQLTDSMLMIPSKSVSGICFPTEQTFASCQLCPRERCPSRQAKYDGSLYDEKYQGAQSKIVLGAPLE